MEFKYFLIIDPDPISCYLTKGVVSSCYPAAEIEIYSDISEGYGYLASQKENCCIIVENTIISLSVKELLTILKKLGEKNFRVLILSNAFQKKTLSLIPKLFHVRFSYKPLSKSRLKQLMEEW